jgi:hypothetical protein
MAEALGLHPARKGQAWDQWYSFLADECWKDDGLLCFYDRNKSPEVAYFCGLLADCLTGSGEERGSEEPEGFLDMGALPGQGENSFAPLKSLSKG